MRTFAWIPEGWNFRRFGLGLLALSTCGYLFYACLGVFLGTFRFDEVYFLQITWAAVRGYSFDYWGPGLFPALLKPFWVVTHGDVSMAWVWRLILFFLAMMQGMLIYRLLGLALPRNMLNSGMIRSVGTGVIVLILCSFRGYELRPEVLPNTLLLVAAWVIFRLVNVEVVQRNDWLLIVAAGMGLVLGASVSTRHALPGVAFFAVLMAQAYFKSRRNAWPLWGILLLCAAFAGYLNGVAYPIWDMLRNASAFQSVREPLTWIQRLSVGGGRFHLLAKGGLIFLLIPMSVTAFVAMDFGKRWRRVAPLAAPALGLGGYYTFLFVVDVHPFEYVRSVEWILLVSAIVALLHELREEGSRWWKGYSGCVALLVLVLLGGATKNLDRERNSTVTLKDLLNSSSFHKLASMSDSELVRRMSNHSILDQMRSRAEYCSRYPNGKAIVFNMMRHPIGLQDEGSSLLGGWSMVPGDVRKIDFGKYQYISLPEDEFQVMEKWKGRYLQIGDVWIRVG